MISRTVWTGALGSVLVACFGVLPPADERLPVPDAAAVAKAEGLFREAFAEELAAVKSDADRAALGRKLLDEAGKTVDNPPGGYVMLREACNLAAAVGDVELLDRSVGLMAGRYAIDAVQVRRDYLAKAAGAAETLTASRAFARASAELMERAVAEDRFDAAADFGRAAFAAAQKGRDGKLVAQIRSRGPQIVSLAGQFERMQAARKTLANDPNHPQANLECGRYLAAVKGDWDGGLPMLAKAGDPKWQAAAQNDMASPVDSAARLAVADAWWDLGREMAEPQRGNLLDRAGHWYRLALAGLEPADRGRVTQRLAAIKGFGRVRPATGPATQAPTQPPVSSRRGPGTAAPEPSTTAGQWTDLLPLVTPNKHRLSGQWRLAGEGLDVVPEQEPARLTLPVAPDGDYDVEIEFTRTATFGTVGIILPVGDRQCMAAINFAGAASGLDTIDGRRANDNMSSFAGALNNDRKYAFALGVRVDGRDAAVTAKLDGRTFFFYRGPAASLALDRQWRIHSPHALGLAVQSPVRFHRVRLRIVSGQVKTL